MVEALRQFGEQMEPSNFGTEGSDGEDGEWWP